MIRCQKFSKKSYFPKDMLPLVVLLLHTCYASLARWMQKVWIRDWTHCPGQMSLWSDSWAHFSVFHSKSRYDWSLNLAFMFWTAQIGPRSKLNLRPEKYLCYVKKRSLLIVIQPADEFIHWIALNVYKVVSPGHLNCAQSEWSGGMGGSSAPGRGNVFCTLIG